MPRCQRPSSCVLSVRGSSADGTSVKDYTSRSDTPRHGADRTVPRHSIERPPQLFPTHFYTLAGLYRNALNSHIFRRQYKGQKIKIQKSRTVFSPSRTAVEQQGFTTTCCARGALCGRLRSIRHGSLETIDCVSATFFIDFFIDGNTAPGDFSTFGIKNCNFHKGMYEAFLKIF